MRIGGSRSTADASPPPRPAREMIPYASWTGVRPPAGGTGGPPSTSPPSPPNSRPSSPSRTGSSEPIAIRPTNPKTQPFQYVRYIDPENRVALVKVYHHENYKDRPSDETIDIFLGGACGKTTWRDKIVIPNLVRLADSAYRANSASFKTLIVFNPQLPPGVDWKPEHAGIEDIVKSISRVRLFWLGRETRAIASMIETAEYARCDPRSLVVLLELINDSSNLTLDLAPAETILAKTTQLKDLARGREYLDRMLRSHGVPSSDQNTVSEDAFLRILERRGAGVGATQRVQGAGVGVPQHVPGAAWVGSLRNSSGSSSRSGRNLPSTVPGR